MSEILSTTHGAFEAFIRNQGIDVVSDKGYIETLDNCTAITVLQQRRRFAQSVVNLSQKARCLITGASALELASGLVKKDPQRIVKGLVGVGVSAVLYTRAEPYFQKRADIAGISQEAIEVEVARR